jgi:hypothetical protein
VGGIEDETGEEAMKSAYANPASSCRMSRRPISMVKPCIRLG